MMVLAAMAKGQQVFAPLGAKWHYSASANGIGAPGSEYYLYEAQKDTVVAAHPCKKITVTYLRYNGDTALLPVFVYQSTDTVFYYNRNYARYFPLYIFNVAPGDTLKYHVPEVPANPADTIWYSIVDSVTDFVVGAQTLKRIWTREPNDISAYSFWGGYIERLGSPFLMLHQPRAIFPEWDGPMRCYSDQDIAYNFNTFPCDYRPVMGIDGREEEKGVKVFPNPVNGILNLQAIDKGPARYSLYNALGQLCLSGQFKEVAAVDLGKLPAGMYVVEVQIRNSTVRKKLVVAGRGVSKN